MDLCRCPYISSLISIIMVLMSNYICIGDIHPFYFNTCCLLNHRDHVTGLLTHTIGVGLGRRRHHHKRWGTPTHTCVNAIVWMVYFSLHFSSADGIIVCVQASDVTICFSCRLCESISSRSDIVNTRESDWILFLTRWHFYTKKLGNINMHDYLYHKLTSSTQQWKSLVKCS